MKSSAIPASHFGPELGEALTWFLAALAEVDCRTATLARVRDDGADASAACLAVKAAAFHLADLEQILVQQNATVGEVGLWLRGLDAALKARTELLLWVLDEDRPAVQARIAS